MPQPTALLLAYDRNTVCLFVCLSVGLDHPPLKSQILLLSMFSFGIAASNSVMKKTTRLASVTYNSTSSELHRHKIIKNDDMGVNIRVPRLMRPCRGFFTLMEFCATVMDIISTIQRS